MVYAAKTKREQDYKGGVFYVIPPMSYVRVELDFQKESTLMVFFYDDVADPKEMVISDTRGLEGLTEAPVEEIDKKNAFHDESPTVFVFAVGVN